MHSSAHTPQSSAEAAGETCERSLSLRQVRTRTRALYLALSRSRSGGAPGQESVRTEACLKYQHAVELQCAGTPWLRRVLVRCRAAPHSANWEQSLCQYQAIRSGRTALVQAISSENSGKRTPTDPSCVFAYDALNCQSKNSMSLTGG